MLMIISASQWTRIDLIIGWLKAFSFQSLVVDSRFLVRTNLTLGVCIARDQHTAALASIAHIVSNLHAATKVRYNKVMSLKLVIPD